MLVTMSAFPESGRSDHQKLSEIKVCFRPRADLHDEKKPRRGGDAANQGGGDVPSISIHPKSGALPLNVVMVNTFSPSHV